MAKTPLNISFGSVCSGIEAASVAWEQYGFNAGWVAEVAAFPSEVLAFRFPAVPNLGDLRGIKHKVLADLAPAPDVLVGGTPCQAFSVAGLRGGLSDARGSLSLTFVELAESIDEKRREAGKSPAVILWENVPGVLSSEDNAFGCLLGGLAGEECELVPTGKGWPDAGCVFGPVRAVAWRVLDAQHFGVAQRRRRVFVCAVGYSANVDPTEILFESGGTRLDVAPRKSSGEALAQSGGTGPAKPQPVVIQGNVIGRAPQNGPGGKGFSEWGVCFTLNCTDKHAVAIETPPSIRRLTPIEHERLQGFPDNWTAVQGKDGKLASDSARYHAVGNSMAVPVMAWIGERIAFALNERS